MFKGTKTILITVIVLNLLVASACYYLFYQITVKSKQASLMSNQMDNKLEEQSTLDSMKTAIDNTSIQIADLESHFVGKDDVIKFIEFVENMGKKSGVKLKTNSVDVESPTDDSTTIDKIHMTIETTGKWQDTFYFLQMLELMKYKAEIKQLKISSSLEPSNAELSVKVAKKPVSEWRADFDFSVPKMSQ